MTFKQFEAIAKEYRPDAIVSRHGEFYDERGVYKLGVRFVKEDGEETRVYMYVGTYAEVLQKLGVDTVTREQLERVEKTLEQLKAEHGTADFFGGTIDNADRIAEYENKLERYARAVRVWEY